MIGDQLPDGFNLGATDMAPAITKLRLHGCQHRRSILERKPIVEPFLLPNPPPFNAVSVHARSAAGRHCRTVNYLAAGVS
jgi:hypothetical protein